MTNETDINETLSALMDGELSEFEIHRFFRELESLPEQEYAKVMETWTRFHTAQNIINKNEQASFSLDISESVSLAIEGEDAHSQSTRWAEIITRPVASMAIAASVTLMVVFGYQQIQVVPGAQTLAANDSPAEAEVWVEEVLEVPEIAVAELPEDSADAEQLESQRRLIDDRINNYLMRHAQNVSLKGAPQTSENRD